MRRDSCVRPCRGQSTLEYAVFIAVVAAALGAMNVYVRRSVQANLKVLEDQVNVEATEFPIHDAGDDPPGLGPCQRENPPEWCARCDDPNPPPKCDPGPIKP